MISYGSAMGMLSTCWTWLLHAWWHFTSSDRITRWLITMRMSCALYVCYNKRITSKCVFRLYLKNRVTWTSLMWKIRYLIKLICNLFMVLRKFARFEQRDYANKNARVQRTYWMSDFFILPSSPICRLDSIQCLG